MDFFEEVNGLFDEGNHSVSNNSHSFSFSRTLLTKIDNTYSKRPMVLRLSGRPKDELWSTNNNNYNHSRDTSYTPNQSSDASSSNIFYFNDKAGEALVPKSRLTDKAQAIFKFTYFNKMQSKCFQTMYEQDHNCVISSPTGSGKTVLFELAILRLLKTHNNVSNIKILYIAPTKALCIEREKDWLTKFSTFGLNVGTLTSDTGYLESEKVKRCNIIITTPEKWDLMTRKWSDYTRLFELIKILLIDEIHILREDRGSTLEVVVTRMKKICRDLKIVALSATVPNIQDVASWIKLNSNNPSNAITMVFGEEYRPVKLQKVIYGYRQTSNDFVFDSILNSKLIEVLNEHSKGKPVLVFCPTRASTVSTAKYISKNFLAHMDLSSNFSAVRERDLADVARKGIAYHHAGLSMEDRSAIEKNFINGSVKILCSTSTLAVGVNLPAYLVVIKGTKIWNSTLFEEYSELDVLQMMGRVGRPQFETQGKAVLMTTQEMKQTYEQLVKGNQKLESRLHLNLHENLVSEVHLRTVTSLEDSLDWLKHTFFYARYLANPTAYGEIPYVQNEDLNGRLMRYTEGKLRELSDYMLIKTVNGCYQSTSYGDSMTRHYILFETMKAFIKAPKAQSIHQLILLIAKSAEFKNIRLKRTEKKLFREINESPILKYPFKLDKKRKNIEEGFEKIAILVQYELGGLEYPNDQELIKLQQSFKQDKLFVFKHAGRLAKCLVDVFVEKKDFISLKNCISLVTCLSAGCWSDTPMVMKQLDGVTLTHVRRLVNQHVRSFAQMLELEPARVEYYLGLRPGNGIKLKNQVASLPRFSLHPVVSKVVRPRNGQGLKLLISCTLDVTTDVAKWKGRTISVVVASGMSTGEVIDFRRSFLAKIKGSSTIDINCHVNCSDSRLEMCLFCEEIAGVGASATLDLTKDLTDSQKSALTTAPEEDDFEIDDDLDSLMVKASLSKQGVKSPAHAVKPAQQATDKASEGQQCKHTCKDKTKCRHLCCREGIAASTAKRTKRVEPEPPLKMMKQKEISGYDLLRKLHSKNLDPGHNVMDQLTRFKHQQKEKPYLAPVEDVIPEDRSLGEDDTLEDRDPKNMLPGRKVTKITLEMSYDGQVSIEETEETSVLDHANKSVTKTHSSIDLIYHDIEERNHQHHYEKEKRDKEDEYSLEDVYIESEVPLGAFNKPAARYLSEHHPSQQPQRSDPLQLAQEVKFQKDQRMDEILDNSLEDELEDLFGSDVEIV